MKTILSDSTTQNSKIVDEVVERYQQASKAHVENRRIFKELRKDISLLITSGVITTEKLAIRIGVSPSLIRNIRRSYLKSKGGNK